jgi:hypothetical protein
MTLPESYEHFRLTNDFTADELIAVMFAAGVFDACYKYEAKRVRGKITSLQEQIDNGLTVKEGINPLIEVYKDTF